MDLILPVEDDRLFSPGKRKIGAMKRFPIEFRRALLKYFAVFMADVYAAELVKAIDSQRFKRNWPPLSPKYLAFKEEMGWSLKIWERTSLLKDSITFWRVKTPVSGFAVGIKPGVTYTVGKNKKKLEVRKVAQWMEFGTGEKAEGGKGTRGWPGMPPRPLFRPLRERLSKDISRHFSRFVNDYGDEIDDLLVLTVVGSPQDK